MISNEVINCDSEVNRSYDMLSNIVYTCINKGVMLDRPHVTLLLISEFLSNHFLMITKHKV